MRILFLTNFFPPARSGGYTQWCHEISESLAARGHTVGVLTSSYELEKAPAREENVFRTLHLEGDLNYYQPGQFFLYWKKQLRENLESLERTVESFAPDLIFIWGMWALSKSLAAHMEKLMPGRVVYYLSDYWPIATDMHTTYWTSPARRWPTRVPKKFLSKAALKILAGEGQPALELTHVICVSARLRDLLIEAGLRIQNARVIHGGTDVERFSSGFERNGQSGVNKLLYAGQLVEHKGVHTAVEAMDRLVNSYEIKETQLTLVGAGHPSYEAMLREQVSQRHLEDFVTFHEPVSKEKMPAIFRQYKILVFPSIYEEPFARTVQEAMASGLAVIGTTTGGTKEILKDGENGLTFEPEDADGLAHQIFRLVNDPQLLAQLANAGRQTVIKEFTLNRMANEIESYLQECLGGNFNRNAIR